MSTGLKQYKLEIQAEHEEKNILVLDMRKTNRELFDQSSSKHRKVIASHIDRFIARLETFKNEMLKN